MVDGKQRDDWNHTADLMTVIAEPIRDKDAHPRRFTRATFHPFLEEPKPEPRPTIPFSALKAIFVDRKVR